MDNIIIEEMNVFHLNSISDILNTEFDDFWNYNIFKNELKNENSKYIVAKLNNEIVGFVGISIVLDVADITNIVVKKKFRGNGISSHLLKHIMQIAKSRDCTMINLEVNCNNSIAINLYKKFGFQQVGRRKNYYQNQDGLLFTKTL